MAILASFVREITELRAPTIISPPPPIVWSNSTLLGLIKIDTDSLIIAQFSIQHHRWKAQNLIFLSVQSDMKLARAQRQITVCKIDV